MYMYVRFFFVFFFDAILLCRSSIYVLRMVTVWPIVQLPSGQHDVGSREHADYWGPLLQPLPEV